MKTEALPIVKKFHCLAKECPRSCCKGWQIVIDDETKALYGKLPGRLKRYIRFHTGRFNGYDVIKKQFGRCPFQDADMLCTFQAAGHPELMPQVCRLYPRETLKYEDTVQVTLDLSCPEAARLLIANPGKPVFSEAAETEAYWITENDDMDYLSRLLSDRDLIVDAAWQDKPLSYVWSSLYPYVFSVHSTLMNNDKAALDGIRYEPGEVKNRGYAFFPLTIIDRMILNHIDYGSLYFREPKFYRILRSYDKLFGKHALSTIDADFSATVEKMCEENPALMEKYRTYFSYNIMQLYMRCYEDYYILRPFLFSILYTELLMIFDMTDYLTGKDGAFIKEERQAEILLLTEHCVRHNPVLSKNLLDVIRQDFL